MPELVYAYTWNSAFSSARFSLSSSSSSSVDVKSERRKHHSLLFYCTLFRCKRNAFKKILHGLEYFKKGGPLFLTCIFLIALSKNHMFLFFDRSRSRLLTERKTRPKAIEDRATIMLECAKHFHFLSNRGRQFFSPYYSTDEPFGE